MHDLSIPTLSTFPAVSRDHYFVAVPRDSRYIADNRLFVASDESTFESLRLHYMAVGYVVVKIERREWMSYYALGAGVFESAANLVGVSGNERVDYDKLVAKSKFGTKQHVEALESRMIRL